MDIQLRALEGYDATRQIRRCPVSPQPPIIAVSSFAMKGDEENARASGCDVTSRSPIARCSCSP
jgi:two-component system, cell cycle response regulator DivK